jgi:hypothetical protein
MNFTDIKTDADYLLDVGMGPKRDPEGFDYSSKLWWYDDATAQLIYKGPPLGIGVTDPARKWELLANALQVIGPELDRRGWNWHKDHKGISIICWNRFVILTIGFSNFEPDHLALLEAYHAAVKAGEDTNANQTD